MYIWVIVFLLVGVPVVVWGQTTSYLRADGMSGNTYFTSDVEDMSPTRYLVPNSGKLVGLYCKFDQFRTDGTAVFTVRKNRADTALTCRTDVRSSECGITGVTVVVGAGDAISIKSVDTSELTAPVVSCMVTYVPQ